MIEYKKVSSFLHPENDAELIEWLKTQNQSGLIKKALYDEFASEFRKFGLKKSMKNAITINLSDDKLDRLNSVVRHYKITPEQAILLLIGAQPKQSELNKYRVTDQSR